MSFLMSIILLLQTFNSFNYESIIEYDKRIRANTLLSDDEKMKFLVNKTLIDEVKLQLTIKNHSIVGVSFVNFDSGRNDLTSILPIEDGTYTLISRSVVQRCYDDQLVLKSIRGVACTCDCKTEVQIVEKEKIVHVVTYKDWNVELTIGGFVVGLGIGGFLTYLLMR